MNELMTTDTKELSPEQLGGEIRLLTTQARRMALSYGIQIGYRLHLAHEKVGPHGWAEWLKKETEFSRNDHLSGIGAPFHRTGDFIRTQGDRLRFP